MLLAVILCCVLGACSDDSGDECELCSDGQVCVGGKCVERDAGIDPDTSGDLEAGSQDSEGGVDAADDGSSEVAIDGAGDLQGDVGPDVTTEAGLDSSLDSGPEASSDSLAPDGCAAPCGAGCCQAGQQCVADKCVVPQGSCATDDDCGSDHACFSNYCLPYDVPPVGGSNAQCARVIPIGVFSPGLQCEWSGPPAGDAYPNHVNVLSTPVVAPLTQNPLNPDAGQKVEPVIIFTSYDRTDGGTESSRCDLGAFGVLRVIRGTDCSQIQTLDDIQLRAASSVAIGDLTGDGHPEIVALRCGGGLVAYSWNPVQGKFELLWTTVQLFGTLLVWSGPSIHDLDDDGKPEVLFGGYVFDNNGSLRFGGLGLLYIYPGTFPVVADVDADGKVELLTGDQVHEWSSTTDQWVLQHATGQTRGQVAVADFGSYGADPMNDDRTKLDGIAETVVVQLGQVRVQTVSGRVIFGPVALPGGGDGGAPTVADFDNDGRAEVACAGMNAYTILDPDCQGPGLPSKNTCAAQRTDGILWTQPSQDLSSSSTGSSVFDFDGDGKAEVIYADECFARVYDGTTGEVLYSTHRTSCSFLENPIVADVDGDFKSELVVPSNVNCATFTECQKNHPKLGSTGLAVDPLFRGLRCDAASDCPGGSCNGGFCRCASDAQCGNANYRCGKPIPGTPGSGDVCRSTLPAPIAGIQVYRDIHDRWVHSRPIWNQHAYSVTNVGELGTIPRTSQWQKNWTIVGLNNFRQNKQGTLSASAVPDLTARIDQAPICDGSGLQVKAHACNRGTKPVGAGATVAFYLGDPKAGGTLGCSVQTTINLSPGICEEVGCTITPAPATPTDLYALADDDGAGNSETVECYEQNNWSAWKAVSCP